MGGMSILIALDGDHCSDHMGHWAAIVVWAMGILYMFLAIAIVCDDFFVASLESISEALNLSEDVAGATFMAAGSSAPELFTSVAGVFFVNDKKDNAGPGTIVGSAVFNISIIIGASVLCAGEPMELDWWPLARDGAFYSFAIVCLFLVFKVFSPEEINWWEGGMFIAVYMSYILLMKYNERIVEYLATREQGKVEQLQDEEMAPETPGGEASTEVRRRRTSSLLTRQYANRPHLTKNVTPTAAAEDPAQEISTGNALKKTALASVAISRMQGLVAERKAREATESEAEPAPEDPINDDDDDDDDDEPPTGAKKILWILSLPIVYTFKLTIPDCSKKKWAKWYPVTFMSSIFWIAFVSYWMVEFGVKMGRCLGLSTTVMGLTVLAAGTSVPDALSSIMVARMGKGNMAVSNAIGSNIFDIFLGLGLPWFLSTALVARKPLDIDTKGLVFYMCMLFLVLVVFLVLVRVTGWVLRPLHGYVLLACYVGYAIVSLSVKPETMTILD